MDQPTLCESGYADYDSCENSVSTNSIKRFGLDFHNLPSESNAMFRFSRSSNDVYEYNSEETNENKIVADVGLIEKKRSHSQAGCDCQLSVREYSMCVHTRLIYSSVFDFRVN